MSRAIRDGYGPEVIGIASYTKAGALEAASRIALPKDNVGTLHSYCYQLLDRPDVAETKLKTWQSAAYPMAGGTDKDDPDSIITTKSAGDRCLYELTLYRNQCKPIPSYLHGFAQEWDNWKQDKGYVDFTDLLVMGMDFTRPFPDCKILFVDEAQDLNPLQAKLIRHWGQNLYRLVLIGDDDQCIYEFTGATPSILVDGLDNDRTEYLRKGHRVPSQVWNFAERIIKNVTHRVPKEYNPPDYEGEVSRLSDSMRMPGALIQSVMNDSEKGTVMILACSAYMLYRYTKVLKTEGIRFHNPYRVDRGDWNPIPARKGGTTANRLAEFLKADIMAMTWRSLHLWADCLSEKAFAGKGIKAIIKRYADDNPDEIIDSQMMYGMFKFALDDIADHNLNWFSAHLLASKAMSFEYPIRVYNKAKRIDDLFDKPKIIVGTIHSVKGGEADTVYLFPDLSPQFSRQTQGGGIDQLYRLFYVGATRARKALKIVGNGGII